MNNPMFAGFTGVQSLGLGLLLLLFWLFMISLAVAGIYIMYLLITGAVQALKHKDTRRLKIALLIIGAFVLQAIIYIISVH